MKTLVYVSTKKDLDQKRKDAEAVFSRITNITPSWYSSQNVLYYQSKFSVNIYHFNPQSYSGSIFDYAMESAIGLVASNLPNVNLRQGIINKQFYGYGLGSINDVVDDILGIRPLLPRGTKKAPRVDFAKEYKVEYKDGKCNHSWKNYTGLRESFKYCEKCDEKEV